MNSRINILTRFLLDKLMRCAVISLAIILLSGCMDFPSGGIEGPGQIVFSARGQQFKIVDWGGGEAQTPYLLATYNRLDSVLSINGSSSSGFPEIRLTFLFKCPFDTGNLNLNLPYTYFYPSADTQGANFTPGFGNAALDNLTSMVDTIWSTDSSHNGILRISSIDTLGNFSYSLNGSFKFRARLTNPKATENNMILVDSGSFSNIFIRIPN